jgi:urea transport system permease protein
VGFMSPSFVGIVPSIEMVISAAVGGRTSLFGAVYGTLLVNFGKTYFSEAFPELWLLLIGSLFIVVVLVFPNGLAGVDSKRTLQALRALPAKLRRSGAARVAVPVPQPATKLEYRSNPLASAGELKP